MSGMKNTFKVYKIYKDGSGEQIAEFQYPGDCSRFIVKSELRDFLTNLGEGDTVSLITIDYEGNLVSNMRKSWP